MLRRHISDDERRARLVTRHRLDGRGADPLDVVRAVTAVHSSDPATPYLALRARIDGFTARDLERALYEERTVCRLHAMRRTLFVVPSDDLEIFLVSVGRDIAAKERRRLEGWIGPELPDGDDPAAWLAELESDVRAVLGRGAALRTTDLAERIPRMGTAITLGSGKWSQRSPVGPRLLYVMAMDGQVVRAHPAGTWRSSQYHWARTRAWLGAEPATEGLDERTARAELARRYLAAHGPATVTDLRWWTGWRAKDTSTALADVDAVAVDLDGGDGVVLPDDLDRADDAVPSVALLPGLDPTVMGWKERDWYLGPHAARLFDTNGNAGPTVWVDGRVVGGWGQRPDGEVITHLLEDVGAADRRRVEREAAELTTWFGGTTVTPRFRTPLERELSS